MEPQAPKHLAGKEFVEVVPDEGRFSDVLDASMCTCICGTAVYVLSVQANAHR